MNFTHLHVHTEFSLLDGSSKIKEIAVRAKELGMDSLAITDHGVMYGAIDFYRACKAAGVKPIIGCEVYVAPGSRFDKETVHGEDRYNHMVLLAENNKGYENLMKIVSKGFVEGFYYKPRVDDEVLREYHEGIIALSACLAGEIPKYLVANMYDKALESARKYRDIFGENNFFLELQDHGISEQALVNQQLIRMSRELNIDLVATNDVHYTYASDAEAHDILLCIQTGKKVSDENRMRYEGGQFYLKSPEEMEKLFPYALWALENTSKIAERCNVEIEFGKTKLPHFEVPQGFDSWSYLNHLCFEGLVKRYGDNPSDVLKDRLNYELSVIKTMGYVDYFLIVWDFINYAKQNNISVGPGRGSAAGSIVAYCLAITELDPIKYNLIFERFLNPERVSMPDIDVDFCYERRQEVIDYVVQKYGKEKVVQIVTFGTLAAKGVIRDVARALDFPYAMADSLAKMVPDELGITLSKTLEYKGELYEAYNADNQVKYLIDMCMRLEGLPRHTSMHAAGVLICPESADNYVPLSRASDGTITTQYIMTTLEELGLLKMDFLGLRTLTVIQNTERLINNNPDINLDISKIGFDDKEVLELIGSGNDEGVFQLESPGMKSFMKELKPQSIEDIIAGISLYRPGPMDFIPKYIAGKNNADSIKYDCPQLEPILAPTYGCIVYQEQVMQIVRDLAGYSWGRSDLVRRAMSKKKAAVMEKERQNFIYGNEEENVPGCVKNGIPESVANKIYDEMIDFAKYAFNKSHAACYAVVSYQTAYLKTHYPVEFMASLMTSVMGNPGKITQYVLVCRKMNIEILPPDVNEGEWDFTVSGNCIRYGMSAIKSVGKPVIEAIVLERRINGPFKDIYNFIDRMAGLGVNKRYMENLIKAGAMDGLNANRRQMLLGYAPIMDSATKNKKNEIAGQMDLFSMFDEEVLGEASKADLPDVEEFSQEELLAFEKEVMGIYVSGHPLMNYSELLEKNITHNSMDFAVDEELGTAKIKDQENVVLGGIVVEKKTVNTKTGKLMAYITLEDMFGTVEVIVFPRDYEKYKQDLSEDEKIFVIGKASVESDGRSRVIMSKSIPFDKVPCDLWIQFEDKASYLAQEDELLNILKTSDGNDRVIIYCKEEKAKKILPNNLTVNAKEELILALKTKFSEKNIKVVQKPIEK